MTLYHGTNVAFREIDLAKGRPFKDFGCGFYAASALECAVKTARQRVLRLGGTPKVVVFEYDESLASTLKVKAFPRPGREWELFVRANRRGDCAADDHNCDNRYDIVNGPIADDRLSLLFRLYERDIITLDEFTRRMQFKELYMQYSFHTARALSALSFKEVLDVR